MRNIKKILLSLVTLGAAAVIGFSATGAFFSDTETSIGNILTAGEIDLKIDNTSYYNHATSSATTWDLRDLTIEKYFDFSDIKPGDVGEDTISLHVDSNDSWVCADVKLTSNDDNGLTEPEGDDGDISDGVGNGELAQHVNFLWWADDGDNVLEEGETALPGGPLGSLDVGETATVKIADSTGSVFGTGPMTGGSTHYIGKAWCFGNITASPLAQDDLGADSPRTPANSTGGVSCDGSSENNVTQTDSLTADVTFRAVQSRNNGDFICNEQPVACVETFATTASNNNQGTQKNGSPVAATRSVPSAMFGVPQTSGADSDASPIEGSFFSLGFTNGNIVLGFDAPFVNGPGDDLLVYEVTGGIYADEVVKVEVGPSAAGPWTVVAAAAARDESIDLGSVASAQFVRLTDVSNIGLFEPAADGYDVDAVKATCGKATTSATPTSSPTSTPSPTPTPSPQQ